MSAWITVLSFPLPHQAHLVKTLLESEDIEVMIADEMTVQVNNFYSNAVGGVKLQVREENLERALQLLKDHAYLAEPAPKEHTLSSKLDHTLYACR